MIVFMAFSGFGIGWGRPVPVNPFNMRVSPRVGMGLTSAAGPFSNLVLAAVFAIPLRLGWASGGLLATFLTVMVYTNVGLALFNLIPLPPLDGFHVIQGVIGTVRTRWAMELGNTLDRIAPYGPMLLLAVLALGWFGSFNLLGSILGPARNALVSLIMGL
jgi:Zn-dependent protease